MPASRQPHGAPQEDGFFSQEGAETPVADVIERILGLFPVRALLSILILLSLVPHRDEADSDLFFLAVFSVEFAFRAYLFVVRYREGPPQERRGRKVRRNALAIALLLIDLVALLSFLPLDELIGGPFHGRLLRLFRLLRMLLFVGYWSPVLQDGLAVLTRHDRLRQVGLLGVVVGLVAFGGATLLAHLPVGPVDFTGDNRVDALDEGFWPRLWWAFRQVQDSSNLTSDPHELLVIVISLGLTTAGIFVVGFLIGMAADIVRELVEAAKNRPVGWKRHTVIVHATPGLATLLDELTRYYERLFRRPRVVIADRAPEPPASLQKGDRTRARWRQVDERLSGLVTLTDAACARRVLVMASAAPFPDALTAATILDLREATSAAWVVAEILDPSNVPAARMAGGPRTIVVPTEKLLGVWALATIRRPEPMPLAWELLATRGGYEIYTWYFDVDGLEGAGAAWDAGGLELIDLIEAAADARHLQGLPRARQRALHGVLPIGVVRESEDRPGASPEDGELALNPRGPLSGRPARSVRAIVAIAHHFEGVRALARHALERPPKHTRAPRREAPALCPPARPRRVTRILMCGFRAASPLVAAGLCAEGADVEVTLAMRHGDSVRAATQALREHGLGSPGASQGQSVRCVAGSFEAEGEAAFRWVPLDGSPGGLVRLVQADWTSERTLLGKDDGVLHVSRYELVLLLGSPLAEYDGRTAMAVLKIADIARGQAARFPTGPGAFRVLAGIADHELGKRLAETFRRRCGREMELLETELLRAQFMFQAVAVPGWEQIFHALLGPGGEGLTRIAVAPRADTGEDPPWDVLALARAYYPRGLLLVGVELQRGEQRVRRMLSTGRETFRESELVAIWAIGPEP